MAEQHEYDAHSVDDPARAAVIVTPDDANDLAIKPTRALWVGGAGALSLIFADETAAVLISGVPAGTLLPFQVKRVRSTGTTATLIAALY